MLAGSFLLVQGVQLGKEVVVVGSPLILTMLVSRLHIYLDQLKMEHPSMAEEYYMHLFQIVETSG